MPRRVSCPCVAPARRTVCNFQVTSPQQRALKEVRAAFEAGAGAGLQRYAFGVVNGEDLAALLALWGTDERKGDLNGDGVVDGMDLAGLLAGWGACE